MCSQGVTCCYWNKSVLLYPKDLLFPLCTPNLDPHPASGIHRIIHTYSKCQLQSIYKILKTATLKTGEQREMKPGMYKEIHAISQHSTTVVAHGIFISYWFSETYVQIPDIFVFLWRKGSDGHIIYDCKLSLVISQKYI